MPYLKITNRRITPSESNPHLVYKEYFPRPELRYSDDQPRDNHGRFTSGGGSGLTSGGNDDTIGLADSSTDWKPVTQEAIDSVPDVTVFKDPELNQAVTESCKEILRDVKDDPVGTEKLISISIQDKKPYTHKGEHAAGYVDPIVLNEPFVSVHNHASGETFSFGDIYQLTERNCKGIFVIGNNGKQYALIKSESFDETGFFEKVMKRKLGYEQYLKADETDYILECEQYGIKYFR